MECLLSFIKEWGALLLSSLGISGGFCAYLRHDRKIKEQELRLNELQIKTSVRDNRVFLRYKCSVKTPPPHTIRSG